VTDDLEREVRKVLGSQRRFPSTLIVCFAIAGIAFAFLWLNHDRLLSSAFVAQPSASSPIVATVESTGVTREDIESLKQQIDGSSKLTTEDLNEQKADLKKLFDQVAALMDKIDALQADQKAMAAHAELQQKPAARPPFIVRKKPVAPKPPDSSPTDGVQLPITPAQ
jgi:hypothetical protein